MKLMIVEDDKALAKGIELALSEKENEITVCHDLKTAEEMWESENADLVILDVNLPDGSGYDFLAFVKESSKVPVILLTANDLEIDQVTGLSLGADDYIMKPFDAKELVARVKAVLRRYQVGSKPETPQADKGKCVEYPGIEINLTNYSVIVDGHTVEMPPKELELLYFLASSPNQVFTREQLLDQIWGYEYIGDTRTVDVHIKRLREKIKDHNGWSLSTVWGIGYKFEVK